MPARESLAVSSAKRRRGARALSLTLGAAVLLAATPAFAQQWNLVGSRFQAMGGAGVGTVEDSTAFYWNPAALGFKKRGEWDVQMPITVNASVENELIEQVSDLAVRADDIKDALNALEGTGGLPDPADVDATISWFDDLSVVGSKPQSVHTELAFGFLGHAGHFGFGALSNTSGHIFPDIDLSNLGLDQTALSTLLSGVTPNPGQETQLKSDVAALGGFWAAGSNADDLVDAFINAPGVDPNNPATRQFIFDLANGVNSGGTFADNTSGVLTAGLAIQEFGVSYGYALPSPVLKRWLDKKISLGITGKYLMGVAFVRASRYTDEVSGGGLGDIDSIKDSVISHNFTLDLGVDYRPLPFARIGIVARNITAPKFKTDTEFGKIKVRPQVRMGMALEPIERLVLALDVDLTENRNPQLEDVPVSDPFRSRLLSLGTEYTIPFGKPSALALRFGAYKNTVLASDEGWALTGGLGLKLWSFVLDLSAGGGLERERIRTDTNEYVNIPDRLNFGLGFKWVKSI